MSFGLLALLDDVAALAKVAATSIDDVLGHAAKAGAKSAGVVIDDAAVTPRYVTGFAAERELPIIIRITRGSLRNKLLFLLPAALALALFAPWAITPLLMLGGAYLAYEGAEKVYGALFPHGAHEHEAKLTPASDPGVLEDQRVASAIKTDFILSAEIMAITLAAIPVNDTFTRAAVLAIVAVGITLGVYGAVALIVKADDVGLALARGGPGPVSRAIGRGLVRGMPGFLRVLAVVGTAAMIWVGGGIIVHGLATFGFAWPEHVIHAASEAAAQAVPAAPGFVGWMVSAAGAGVAGLVVGFVLIPLVGSVLAPLVRRVVRLFSRGRSADHPGA
jgi:predicted DNA repair protein MutK